MTMKHDDALDDYDIIPDGGTIRVPMVVMDGARPRSLADAQLMRERARVHWIKSLQDVWRAPLDARRSRVAEPDDEPDDDDDEDEDNRGRERRTDARSIADARAMASRAYDQMCRRLEQAWRTPARGASQPDTGSSPARDASHLRTGDAQAKRDDAYQQYVDRLTNAWKTDPNAATAIEQQGEKWRGGR
jgi:hypothetical protein